MGAITHYTSKVEGTNKDEVLSKKSEKIKTVVATFHQKKLEIQYNGYLYNVTKSIHKFPCANIIYQYAQSKKDASSAIPQFHFGKLANILEQLECMDKRVIEDRKDDLNLEKRSRHKKITEDFLELTVELETEGFLKRDSNENTIDMSTSSLIFLGFLILSYWLSGTSFTWNLSFTLLTVMLTTLNYICLGNEERSISLKVLCGIINIFWTASFGFLFGLSLSNWKATFAKYHALFHYKTRKSKVSPADRFEYHFDRLWFIFWESFIVSLSWKLNHHLEHSNRFELFSMLSHYTLIYMLGFWNWMYMTWMSSIFLMGTLILSHVHLPILEKSEELHWVEYAFYHTTNIRFSNFINFWNGHLCYQIEHQLFPNMPFYKRNLCAEKIKYFAERNGLPYLSCSIWEAIKIAYFDIENISKDIIEL